MVIQRRSGAERSPQINLIRPSDSQDLLSRFPEQGIVINCDLIMAATLRESSRHRSNRWHILYNPNLRQTEVLFSKGPNDPLYRKEGIILRGDQLSVYSQDGLHSKRSIHSGVVGNQESPEVKIALMRVLRTLRLAPQLPK